MHSLNQLTTREASLFCFFCFCFLQRVVDDVVSCVKLRSRMSQKPVANRLSSLDSHMRAQSFEAASDIDEDIVLLLPPSHSQTHERDSSRRALLYAATLSSSRAKGPGLQAFLEPSTGKWRPCHTGKLGIHMWKGCPSPSESTVQACLRCTERWRNELHKSPP